MSTLRELDFKVTASLTCLAIVGAFIIGIRFSVLNGETARPTQGVTSMSISDDEYPMQTYGANIITQQRLVIATVNLNQFGQTRADEIARQIAESMNAQHTKP